VPIVVIALLGAGIYWRIKSKNTSATNGANPATVDASGVAISDEFSTALPIAVEGVPVILDTLIMKVQASGQAAAVRQTILSAQVNGMMISLPVRENSFVQAGQLLLEVDPTELRLDLRRAQADSIAAWNRYRLELLNDSVMGVDPSVRASREKAARERAGIESAQISLERARLNLSYARVTAPFAGRVANLMVVPDQYVRSGTELLTIVDINPIRVLVDVLESDLAQIEVGRGASVVFAAREDTTFRGVIETINPLVDERRRTARVTVRLNNANGFIKPGFFANVTLDAKRHPNRTLVPIAAVLERDNRRTLVFIFEGTEEGGTAQWQYVRTGLRNDTYVEIIEDPEDPQTRLLRPGEIVLIRGHESLTHGAAVRLATNALAEGGRPR
jgi:RND family efflux transporter MFP subunit